MEVFLYGWIALLLEMSIFLISFYSMVGCSRKKKSEKRAEAPQEKTAPPLAADKTKIDGTTEKVGVKPGDGKDEPPKPVGLNEDPGGYENCEDISSKKLKKIAMQC